MVPFSTKNPHTSPSSLAHTTATSAMVPLVIHILAPFNRKPSFTFPARVVIPPGSEPWSGSVRPKQPTASPRANLGSHRSFWATLPKE